MVIPSTKYWKRSCLERLIWLYQLPFLLCTWCWSSYVDKFLDRVWSLININHSCQNIQRVSKCATWVTMSCLVHSRQTFPSIYHRIITFSIFYNFRVRALFITPDINMYRGYIEAKEACLRPNSSYAFSINLKLWLRESIEICSKLLVKTFS